MEHAQYVLPLDKFFFYPSPTILPALTLNDLYDTILERIFFRIMHYAVKKRIEMGIVNEKVGI